MKQQLKILIFSTASSLVVMSSAAFAQTAIPITGGTIVVDGLNNPDNTTATFITPQGTVDSATTEIVTTNGWLNPCCSLVGHMSGVGYSANGPVVFSNLPWVVETPAGTPYTPVGGSLREIAGGVINGPYENPINPRFVNRHIPGSSIMHNLAVQDATDLSAGQFSFEPLPEPVVPLIEPTAPVVEPVEPVEPVLAVEPTTLASNFEIPEFLTEPGNPEQPASMKREEVAVINGPDRLQPQRLNGVHTRIIPAWTPGLYQ